MFSFRRKPKKSQDDTRIRTSPSLPELHSQGIPWPENLVDVDAIRQSPTSDVPLQGATKASFQGMDHVPIVFHKPFRGSPGKLNDGEPISSLYMSNAPSAFEKFENRKSNTPTTGRYNRRARIPPTFNLMASGYICWTWLDCFFLTKAVGCWWQRNRKDVLVTSSPGDC